MANDVPKKAKKIKNRSMRHEPTVPVSARQKRVAAQVGSKGVPRKVAKAPVASKRQRTQVAVKASRASRGY
jgi:hypothetical protein